MPRKKKTAKEIREKQKKERLARLAGNKEKKPEIIAPEIAQIPEELLQESSKVLEKEPSQTTFRRETVKEEERFFRSERSRLQQELYTLHNPEILEMPDFLTDPDKSEEREEVFSKIEYLLKRRFSLVAIADVLETNGYDRLDEFIDRKERLYKSVESYTTEETPKPLRLFSDFKDIVGSEYSRTYSEQEERMKAAITILKNGKYFKRDEKGDDITVVIEDIVASIIDSADFNLACQIETEFVDYEMNKAITVLSDLRQRRELQDLVDELIAVSRTAEERSHAYNVMDMLIYKKKTPRQIINIDNVDDEKGER